MTERQSNQVIEILRSSLGMQYHAGMSEGRREIARVLADELRLGGDEADAMVSRLIAGDQIRYVTADERDPVEDREAQHDEHTDTANQGTSNAASLGGPLISAIPGQGGQIAGPGGMSGSAVIPPGANLGAGGPVAASGSGGAAPGTLAFAGADAAGGRADGGYWDFAEAGKGVVPSTTRKGQVEPKGT